MSIFRKTLVAAALAGAFGFSVAALAADGAAAPAAGAASSDGCCAAAPVAPAPAAVAPAPDKAAAAGDKAAAIVPQTNCPVMGGKINKKVFVDYQGKRVYFCCPGCPAQFKKDPAKYIKAMEDKGITLDKTPQPAVAPAGKTMPMGMPM